MKKNLLMCLICFILVHLTYGQEPVLDSGDVLKPSSITTSTRKLLEVDTDNDGVPDSVDLDDDNDGILDSDECVVAINLSGNNSSLTAVDDTDVQEGEKILYTDAIMKDNVYYDIVFTLLEKSRPAIKVEVTYGIAASKLVPYKNDYIRYKLDLVEKGSATTANPEGTPATISDIILSLADIDSYRSLDFTEVTGIEMGLPTSPESHSLNTPTLLEVGGFKRNGPAGNIALYRLVPKDSGSNQWRNNLPSVQTDLENKANYQYATFTSLNAVFGVTGGYNSEIGVRKNYFDIASPCDEDRDNYVNRIDIDADNDGIPDNVEAQPTIGYQAPATTVDANGIPTNYNGVGLLNLVDTDGDGLKDFKDPDSENDGIPDINENGMANSLLNVDTDGDGLDDAFEGSNLNDPADVNDEIDDPTDLTVLPDSDNNLFSGGDLDYRDVISLNNSVIDFDGVDDYVDSDVKMSGFENATLMAWVKLDKDFANQGHIVGENVFRIYVDRSQRAVLEFIAAAGPNKPQKKFNDFAPQVLKKDCWYHLAAKFDSKLGEAILYINGKPSKVIPTEKGMILKTNASNKRTFALGKLANTNTDLFKGCIDEVRLFKKTLTDSQLQGMIYQEIRKDKENVSGAVIPKNVIDFDTGEPLKWNTMEVYYTFETIRSSASPDLSRHNRPAYLHNITTFQEQTAPMPYTTVSNGEWSDKSIWLNGEVIDAHDIKNEKPWSIVRIKNNISTNNSHTNLGLLIDDGKELLVDGDNAITNNYYLSLGGHINLLNDSQLVQGMYSDLVTSENGELSRRQEGTNNGYRYNYWSPPIGVKKATSLINENALVNNANNSDFNIGMLKFGNGEAVQFTDEYNEAGKISTRWLYKFENGIGYEDWISLAPSSPLNAGQGYTQKGTGIQEGLQHYIFNGKPHNGTVTLDVDDVGGSAKKTKYLIGNPYPSAIDIREFIKDNEGAIYGTIYLWEQWAGNSHVLGKYEGGYGTINLTATVRAYQHADIPIANQEQPFGIKLPTFNIAVAQGFFTEIVGKGKVIFKNSQRKFVKEADADGRDPENGSIFAKQQSGLPSMVANFAAEEEAYRNYDSEMGILRLEFTTSLGQSRHIVLGFSDFTTDGFDYGYDGKTISRMEDDLNSVLDGRKMTIQAYAQITPEKVVDLIFNSKEASEYGIQAVEMSDIDPEQEIYLRDNVTGTYFDLTSGEKYEFENEENGEFPDRFDIVFQKQTMSVLEHELNAAAISVYTTDNILVVKGLNDAPKQLTVTDVLGKIVMSYSKPSVDALENGLELPKVTTGTYFVSIKNSSESLTKKIIIK